MTGTDGGVCILVATAVPVPVICHSHSHSLLSLARALSQKKLRLSHSQPVSHLNLCLLLNLFSNASDALRAARADGRHYVPLSLNRLGRVINTHGDILAGLQRVELKTGVSALN